MREGSLHLDAHPRLAPLRRYLGDRAPEEITVIGEPGLLEQPLLGFFCSRRAPGGVILKAYDWARAARDAGLTVVGGFQSPMERECLDFLLRGTQPVVICPARGIGGMRLPEEWRGAVEQGRLLVLSPFADRQRRATSELAAERNRFVAALAERILIAHAAPGGTLRALMEEVRAWDKPVYTFDDPSNVELLGRKAQRWSD
jgi:predicted Rossmann fold nucleotide-binding protein DprA/Smf involved in DNA uptake